MSMMLNFLLFLTMEYKEYKPDKLLAQFIECYWSAYSDRPPFREQESLIPDGTIELMFNFGDDYAQIKNGEKIIIKGSHLIGIRKQALKISQTARQNVFSVRFKLGGTFPFFKIPVHLFANNFFGLEDLIGKEYDELGEKLYQSGDDYTRISIIENFLIKKLHNQMYEYYFTDLCSKTLLQNPTIKIKDLAYEFNTNYKTIERRFKNVIGLTPVELLQIKRFNNAIVGMHSGKHSTLTEVAYESGYYDQSHFIREFKHLSGYTPGDFLKEQFTIVQVIQPALAERMSKLYNS
jgi:AraC-like DNA-binding protein